MDFTLSAHIICFSLKFFASTKLVSLSFLTLIIVCSPALLQALRYFGYFVVLAAYGIQQIIDNLKIVFIF